MKMKGPIRSVSIFFILIGIAVGIILSLQIRAQPIKIGTFPLDRLEIQKSLLATFSSEQESLKKQLASIEEKYNEAQKIIEQRSSKKTIETIARLKQLSGFDAVTGEGIRITLQDNPSVTRLDFSTVNEHFVQATDLRDLVNALFLQDASALAINGKRVLPLTSIQAVFDSILVGNFQISSPFVIEAIGDPQSLEQAVAHIKLRKIQVFLGAMEALTIKPAENIRATKFITLSQS